MNKYIRLICLLFLFKSSFGFSIVGQDGDWQLWVYNRYFGNFTEKLGMMIEEEFRVGDNISKLFYVHTIVGIYYNPFSWLSIMPAYEQLFLRRRGLDDWFPVYDPFLQVLFTKETGKWIFRNRSRFEYVMPDNGISNNFFLYRNLCLVVFPFRLTKLNIEPFFDEEVFFSSRDGFDQFRLTGGFQTPILRELAIDLYYRYRGLKRQSGWVFHNIIGVNFAITF